MQNLSSRTITVKDVKFSGARVGNTPLGVELIGESTRKLRPYESASIKVVCAEGRKPALTTLTFRNRPAGLLCFWGGTATVLCGNNSEPNVPLPNDCVWLTVIDHSW